MIIPAKGGSESHFFDVPAFEVSSCLASPRDWAILTDGQRDLVNARLDRTIYENIHSHTRRHHRHSRFFSRQLVAEARTNDKPKSALIYA